MTRGALLAFDTSTETLAVALAHGAHRETEQIPGGAASSLRLLPLAAELLARASCDWSALDGVAFGAGPGAFTGLRTSCAVAQGLAFGRGVPVWPIDSLAIVAEDARAQLDAADPAAAARPLGVLVAMDARMGEVYVAAWHWDAARGWHGAAPAALSEPDSVGRWQDAAWSVPEGGAAAGGAFRRVVCGSALAVPALRRAGLTPPAGVQEIVAERDRAGALLRLALHAREHAPGLAPEQALPVYLRDKVAQTVAERAAAREAAEGAR